MAKKSPALRAPADLEGRCRILIEGVRPEIDAGRYPIKRVVGDRVAVEMDLVADGHDVVAGALLHRPAGEKKWQEVPLESLGNDRYRASFAVESVGRHLYTIEAWIDHFATYRHGLRRKVEAGQDVAVELLVGAKLVEAAAERAGRSPDARELRSTAKVLRDLKQELNERIALVSSDALAERMGRHPDRRFAVRYERELGIVVDRERARFSAWYEFFPRSFGPGRRHGTFADAESMLPYVADLGFDVVYLPPIHPIGQTFRKGPNNTLTAGPDDPGSPWAIGSAEGGHKAIHPDLGTLDDFRAFRARAESLGLEIALDVAFQVSPDHPYVREHPEWFVTRPDGTIQYAENPPKKYQDVYPFDFECDDWRGLWEELASVFFFWIEQGVRIFRVDNPHTKSLKFWEWCIGEIKARHPDVLFLSEAFTRPKLMYALAKLGFTQSYTYFTWRNTRWELTEYLTELTRTEVAEYFRPNFWPNTPDILPEHLQYGGRPAFLARVVLASMLSSNYGLYGPAYELLMNVARPGSGEYIDNEKYQLVSWDLDASHSIRHVLSRLNRIRRENPALGDNQSLVFHPTDNDQFLCFSKRSVDGANVILVLVNLDFQHRQAGFTDLDLGALGLGSDEPFEVHDLLGDARYIWHGARNYVELNPHLMPAHVFRITPHLRREQDFETYE